ncbi:MAG: AAA family ATPase [Thermoplasmata archaeon]|nr:AAA family ATPase [Thermoplasmata archaeon]
MRVYDPQTPASPESFAGRSELQEYVREALDTGARLGKGSSMLLHGYRGSGKTSALRKIQSIVLSTAPDAVVVEVPLRVPSSEAMLIHAIAEQIRRTLAARPGLSTKVRRALDSLSAVNVLGTGVERTVSGVPGSTHPLTVWNDALGALQGVPILAICIDDAELLRAEEIGILKTMAETASPIPILLAIAGGPELKEKMSQKDASPILRVFSGAVFDIGQFTETETREALDAPLKRAKISIQWDPSAVGTLHHLTHGYPYLVQCFAAATFDQRHSPTSADVRLQTPAALQLAASWLERELPDASDEDIRAFARIAGLGRSDLGASDIRSLRIDYRYITRLVAEGVLKRLARGHYELRKAPAIAYFHALRRGLVLEPVDG